MDFFSFTFPLPFVAVDVVIVIIKDYTQTWLWGMQGRWEEGGSSHRAMMLRNSAVMLTEGCIFPHWWCSPGLRRSHINHQSCCQTRAPTPAGTAYTHPLQKARNCSAREHRQQSYWAMPGAVGAPKTDMQLDAYQASTKSHWAILQAPRLCSPPYMYFISRIGPWAWVDGTEGRVLVLH